jgi:hypothetical protein
VSDGPKESDEEAARQFRKRVRRGAGSDKSATGATRIAGSLNFKSKYALDFPLVEITHTNPGKTVTVAELENAGLVAPREQPQPPARHRHLCTCFSSEQNQYNHEILHHSSNPPLEPYPWAPRTILLR